MRTASRGQVYLGGALWQMLQSAVKGVDESAIFFVRVLEDVLKKRKMSRRGLDWHVKAVTFFRLSPLNPCLHGDPVRRRD